MTKNFSFSNRESVQKMLNSEKKINLLPVNKTFYCTITVIINVVWKLVYLMKIPVKVMHLLNVGYPIRMPSFNANPWSQFHCLN